MSIANEADSYHWLRAGAKQAGTVAVDLLRCLFEQLGFQLRKVLLENLERHEADTRDF